MKHLLKPVAATAFALFVSVCVSANQPSCSGTGPARLPALQLQQSGANPHLEQTDARILLRLELEALKKAILSADAADTRRHLTNAIIFRKYRYQLYPEAANSENDAELSQGMVAYNDLEASKKKTHEITPYLVSGLKKMLAEGNLAQDFAQQTVPMYGFVMKQANKNWPKEIKAMTSFTALVISEVNLKIPVDVKAAAKRLEKSYDGPEIAAEENARIKN